MFVDPTCKHCGHAPCSVDAAICPRCGKSDPNPGMVSRVKAVLGAFVGSLIFLPCSLFLIAPAYGVHPSAGLVVGLLCLAWAAYLNIRARWYALDPTMSVTPRKIRQVSPFQN
jgi:hypothetical protein